MKENFVICIETLHAGDVGDQENVSDFPCSHAVQFARRLRLLHPVVVPVAQCVARLHMQFYDLPHVGRYLGATMRAKIFEFKLNVHACSELRVSFIDLFGKM